MPRPKKEESKVAELQKKFDNITLSVEDYDKMRSQIDELNQQLMHQADIVREHEERKSLLEKKNEEKKKKRREYSREYRKRKAAAALASKQAV